jgi:hypothetical protein
MLHNVLAFDFRCQDLGPQRLRLFGFPHQVALFTEVNFSIGWDCFGDAAPVTTRRFIQISGLIRQSEGLLPFALKSTMTRPTNNEASLLRFITSASGVYSRLHALAVYYVQFRACMLPDINLLGFVRDG